VSIEADILDHLMSDMDVSALVGDSIFSRRHPAKVPAPFIVFRRVSTLPTMSHDGPGLRGALFEVTGWAVNGTQAGELRRAIARAFDVVTTTTFRSFVQNELELEATAETLARGIVDVRVWYDSSLEAIAS
jgi:hypothetical protein